MKIAKDKVVAFHYSLKDQDGTELEQTADGDEPMVYLHGHGNILEGLESQLKDKQAGDEVSVTLPPERAYGLRTGDSMQRVPIKHLITKAKRYQPGMVVKVNSGNGPRDVVILKVGRFNVDVDTNHPLAGKTLTFDIHIDEVRDANPEELSHGHSHGVHGHSHH
jgi:FKBP-type peptidyl-prolyl cis-trans isomerase SlyD